MSIEDIRRDYTAGKYHVHEDVSEIETYEPDTVFDENMSVKWNREQVAIRNERASKKIKAIRDHEAELNRKLHSDVASAIMEEYGFNLEQAQIIEGEAYSDKHYCMHDYFNYVGELSDLVQRVMKASDN